MIESFSEERLFADRPPARTIAPDEDNRPTSPGPECATKVPQAAPDTRPRRAKMALVDLGNAEGFASLQIVDPWQDEIKRRQDSIDIHHWEQLVHSFRTHVTSLHHNVFAALAEKFGPSWTPASGGEPIWLLGRRYEAEAEAPEFSEWRGSFIDATSPVACGIGAAVWPDLGPPTGVKCSSTGGTCTLSSYSRCRVSEEFSTAWSQIPRMTYRKGFAPMYRCVRNPTAGSDERAQYIKLTSDAGWGCMIRVGQMLLATALKRHQEACSSHHLQSGARSRCAAQDQAGKGDTTVSSSCGGDVPSSSLERLFLDDPRRDRSPFSIFSFIRAAYGREVTCPSAAMDCSAGDPYHSDDSSGARCGDSVGGVTPPPLPKSTRQLTEKKPGDWFGPTTVSETIAALVEQNNEFRNSLAVYVDADGVLYEDEVRALGSGRVDALACATPSETSPDTRVLPRSPQQQLLSSQQSNDYHVERARCVGGSIGDPLDEEFEMVSTTMSLASRSPLLAAMHDAADCSCGDSGGEFEEARAADADVMVGSFCDFRGSSDVGGNTWSLGDLDCSPLPPAAMDVEFGADETQSARGGLCTKSVMESSPGCPLGLCAGMGSGQSGSSSPALTPSPSSAPAADKWPHSVLLLFPLQLGLEKHVSSVHANAVLKYFEFPSSLGAMGGRPRMAHFFVGRQGRGLLYVDPHVVQPAAVPTSEEEDHGAETFRNAPSVQTIPVEHIDSSISCAFYCTCEADLLELLAGIRNVEAAEANAPIRAEQTRPPALRPPHGLWRCVDAAAVAGKGVAASTTSAWQTAPGLDVGSLDATASWRDIDGLGGSFMEVRCHDATDGGCGSMTSSAAHIEWDALRDSGDMVAEPVAGLAIGGGSEATSEDEHGEEECQEGTFDVADDADRSDEDADRSDDGADCTVSMPGFEDPCSRKERTISVGQPWAMIEASIAM
mmetsp:Transcript_44493/g.123122  ORF Transcript_44493/g.123122 Transcript_44493/m.123122 type:complete len:946 (-) Transcript_44493:147-2984(-)